MTVIPVQILLSHIAVQSLGCNVQISFSVNDGSPLQSIELL